MNHIPVLLMCTLFAAGLAVRRERPASIETGDAPGSQDATLRLAQGRPEPVEWATSEHIGPYVSEEQRSEFFAGPPTRVSQRVGVQEGCSAGRMPADFHHGLLGFVRQQSPRGQSLLMNPDAPELNRLAPDLFHARLQTSKGLILIEVHRTWAPRGADRFYNLVGAGYYDEARFFRVVKDRWAQFGVHGDPRISAVWRSRTLADDPAGQSNVRGTVAYAFAVPNGRTTQVFINLVDNSSTHDKEPFVPFGRIIEGMDVAAALNSEYGDSAGGGIRAGRQDVLFAEGNRFLMREFPRLDYIVRATIERPVR